MLAQLASHLRLDLIMLQEVSIVAGSGLHREDLGAGWTLHFSTADSRGRGGVGALVGPRLQQSFCCVEVSARLLRVDVRLRGRNARLFCAYAPTAAHPQEAGEFFELLAGQLEGVAERDTLVVLGDLNAVVQRTQRSPFVLPRLNANSVALADFMARFDLVSANTRFRKPAARLATFAGCKRRRRNARGPNATTRLAQLDHVLVRFRERSRVTNCDTMEPLAVRSDHRLLHCDLHLKDPLYRPPKRQPRRYFAALRDPGTRGRFAYAFATALGSSAGGEYSAISAAVASAASKTLPLMQPASRRLPVWASDPEVTEARRRLERLRRTRRPTVEAEEALADVYARRQQAAVSDAVRAVTSAGPDRQNRVVWPVVNALTGRKRKTALNLAGDTPEARRNELRDFFAAIVNAPSPSLPDEMPLPSKVELPRQEAFNTGPVTSTDVVEFARKALGGRAPGPDEVPVEALRVPRVAMEVARVMNGVLEGGTAPSEWNSRAHRRHLRRSRAQCERRRIEGSIARVLRRESVQPSAACTVAACAGSVPAM
jgi:exonuclease III